jgi:hypothetical protein
MIANLHRYEMLQNPPDRPSTFQEVDEYIPFLEDKSIGNIHDIFTQKTRGIFPRMFKTHQPWQCDVAPCKGWMVGRQAKWQCECPTCASKYKRVIYILREGRAAMFSYFKFQKELRLRGRTKTFHDYLKYRKRRYPGCSWSDHIRSWFAAPSNIDILWIKYENMIVNASKELQRVASFLEVKATPKALEWSVQASNRKSMRKTEKETGAGLFHTKYKKRDSSFMMTHTISESTWQEQFLKGNDHGEENENYWNDIAGYMNRCLGY